MTQSLIFNRYKFKTFCVFSILFGASLIISNTPAYSASVAPIDEDTWHNERELKLAEFCDEYKNEVVGTNISDYSEKDGVCSIELSGKNTTSEINEKIKQIAQAFNDSCNTNESEYKNHGHTLAWSVKCEHITLSIEVDDEDNITCSDNEYTFNSQTGECEAPDDLFDLNASDKKRKDDKAEEDREDEDATESKLAEFCDEYENNKVVGIQTSYYHKNNEVCYIDLSGNNTTSEINAKIKQIAEYFNDSCDTNKSEYNNNAWSVPCEHITLNVANDGNITCSDNEYTFNSQTGECETPYDLDDKTEEDREDEGNTSDPGKTGETQDTNIEQLHKDAQKIVDAYTETKKQIEAKLETSNQ